MQASPSSSDEPAKKRRRRSALSCTQCRDRRIRCDRNVPNCSSCVTRGIQRACRWGDDRDEAFQYQQQQRQKDSAANGSGIATTSAAAAAAAIAAEVSVDNVVEKVLKRLKGEDEESPKEDRSSAVEYMARPRLTHQGAAHRFPSTAFEGFPPRFPDLRGSKKSVRSEAVTMNRLCKSLQALPSRRAMDRVVEAYLAELEPRKGIFNSVILRQQMDQFWNGVKELGINKVLIWPNETEMQNVNFAPHVLQERPSTTFPEPLPFLATTLRQGLIGLVFALLVEYIHSVEYPAVASLNIFPSSTTEEQVKGWVHQYYNLAVLHLNLSDYIEQPTLWSLQILRLLQTTYMKLTGLGPSSACVSNSIALRLAVTLGLNRLGSAVDDAKAIIEKSRKNRRGGSSRDTQADSHIDDNVPTNMVASAWGVMIASFEEGDLALRELGRKLWIGIVIMDYVFGAHMDHMYLVNDAINQTSPPSPIDDEEIMTEAAPVLLSRKHLSEVVSLNPYIGCMYDIARAGRLQVELENVHGSPLAYQYILEVDDVMQEAIREFPWYFHYTYFKGGPSQQHLRTAATSRALDMQRVFIQEQSQFRLLRLHRFYLGKGFKDEKYRPSVEACVHAARVLVQSLSELARLRISTKAMFHLRIHVLHAVLVLHLTLMFENDQRQEEASRKKKRAKYIYVVDDFAGLVEDMQSGLHCLREDPENAEWLTKGLHNLDNSLLSLLRNGDQKKETEREQDDKRLLLSPTYSAAGILASIPTAAISHSNLPDLANTSTNPMATSMTAAATTAPSTWTSMDPYSEEFWSLEALFPDYATNSMDLIDAFEKVVWT